MTEYNLSGVCSINFSESRALIKMHVKETSQKAIFLSWHPAVTSRRGFHCLSRSMCPIRYWLCSYACQNNRVWVGKQIPCKFVLSRRCGIEWLLACTRFCETRSLFCMCYYCPNFISERLKIKCVFLKTQLLHGSIANQWAIVMNDYHFWDRDVRQMERGRK